MTTFYHVAPLSYNEGEPIYSWSAYIEQYGEPPTPWKWSEVGADEGQDGDLVSLFEDYAEAVQFAQDYYNGQAKILTISFDDYDGWALQPPPIIRNDERYACVVWKIEPWAITNVETLAA